MWLVQWLNSRSLGNEFGVPVRNFAKVDDRLYRGALPDEAGYRAMHENVGIQTVINLVPGDREVDRKLALAAGIEHWDHIPFSDRHMPEDDLVREWLGRVRESQYPPIYMHCRGGRHRTGTLIAVYRCVVYSWSKEKAFEEMMQYGWYDALGHAPLRIWFFEHFNPDEYR